ncbi:MAG: hypothetical protein HBSAPP02_22880 [Phycisphaerae bacterium]|nr:MAG: hypothetical protein HBSAPP02_22880 [Phycisphaerae bacterium]
MGNIMSKRAMVLCLLGGLALSLGMTADGCGGVGSLLNFRGPPAIIPNVPDGDTFTRTFTVDLRAYPETHRINWDFGDGGMLNNMTVSTGRTVSHQYTGNGVFNVRVHLFSAADPINGTPAAFLATGSIPVEVRGPNVAPTAAFVFSDVRDSEDNLLPLSRRFNASTSRDPDGVIESFAWDFGDGTSDVGSNVVHEFPRSGRFVVRLTVRDDRGAASNVTRTVLINALPTAVFTFTQDPNNALRFNFDATGSTDSDGNIVRFAWDFADGQTGEGATISHTYAEPNDYNVRLTVTDEVGASSSTTRLVDVVGTDVFVRSLNPDFGVVGTTVTGIIATGENFVDGAIVRLTRNATTIEGTNVVVQGSSTLTFDVDLRGAPLGDYSARVINPDASSDTLDNAFRVVTANRVRLSTTLGDMVFELVDDAPITTANFLQYVTDGFYNGTIFHRVVPGFVVQGGGFLPGNVQPAGLRPPIQNEFSPSRSNVRATVAMAKLGGDPNSATSQFFVNLADNSANLDNQNGGFTVFARVVEGMDVVDAIAAVPLNGEQPITDVIVTFARRE